MANEEHLEKLKSGLDKWNSWRKYNLHITPDLSRTDLSGMDLATIKVKVFGDNYGPMEHFDGWSFSRDANFQRVVFSGSCLARANLQSADLRQSNFRSILIDKTYSQLLTEYESIREEYEEVEAFILDNESMYGSAWSNIENRVSGRYNAVSKALNERKNAHEEYADGFTERTDLEEADLTNADLRGADLTYASFIRTDLSRANLSGTIAIGTCFREANLTGACIYNWSINSKTDFSKVKCNYIYLKEGFTDRRPIDKEKYFEPGEMEILFRQIVDTIDLVFATGVDWGSFLASFQELQVEYEEDGIAIQAIERKHNAFVVRLEVNRSNEEKSDIEKYFWKQYAQRLESLESDVHGQRELILAEREEKSKLIGVVEALAASRPSVFVTAGDVSGGKIAVSSSQIENTVMGDKFENISNSTILNRASVKKAMNTIPETEHNPCKRALRSIAEHIEEFGDSDAKELFDGVSKELGEQAPNKVVLKSIWNALVRTLPDAAKVAKSIETLGKYIE